MGVAPASTKWVYDFAEGSREMKNLLGGKGANVAEMTRILGADRVPAGFTITTEACVTYMEREQSVPDGMDGQVDEALARLEDDRGQDPRRPRRSVARLRAQRRARVDAGHARHGPEPRPQRRVGGRSGREDRQRALRVGLLPTLCADVRKRGARHPRREVRDRHQGGQAGARRHARHRARHRRAPSPHRALSGDLQGRHRRGLPAAAARPADAGDPRGLRLLGRRPRRRLPAHQPHPRRLGHGRQRPADGLRQQGRHVGLRRRLQPRRGRRRARAVGRLPRQRPGRGRRLRRAQHPGHRRPARRHARGARDAHGDPAHPRGALQGHAGHGVHDRGRPSVHAADAQRQAPRAGRACASPATASTRAC